MGNSHKNHLVWNQ